MLSSFQNILSRLESHILIELKMKSINNIFCLLATAILAWSCNDFLNEYDPNSVTEDNFYENEDDIHTSMNGVYASLKQSFYFTNGYYFSDVRAHETAVTDAGANSGIPYQFYNYSLNEENAYVYNRYTQIYKSIVRANTLISHLDDVTYSNPDSRDSYEAQARFVRALGYYYLVTEWGDVPLILKALSSVSEINAADVRVPKGQIYDAIFADLDYVLASPLSDFASVCGRAGKVAAMVLYGKAALQKACDEDFESSKKESFKLAFDQLTDAWGKKTFSALSTIPYSDIWDLSTQKTCAENIFQLNYIQNNESLGSSFSYLFGPIETGITSMHTGSASNMATTDTYESFEKGDARKGFLATTTLSGVTYYHSMKFVDLECGANGYGGNNWIVFRYADVALMLAEAYYWTGDENNAKLYLNMVRARAGLSDWTGTDLRQGIYDERRHEFIQEGLRWQDLLRMYSSAELLQHFNAINSNFGLKDLLLPIPYNERILNPEGMYQNFGY